MEDEIMRKNKDTVLFVTGNFSFGGAPKMMTFVANNACDVFRNVHIVSFTKTPPRYKLRDDIAVHFLEIPSNALKYLKRLYQLKTIMKQINPDVIVAFRTAEVMYASLVRSSKMILIGSERGNPEKASLKYRIIAKIFFPKCNRLVFQTEQAALHFGMKIQKKSVVIPNPLEIAGTDPGVFKATRDRRIVIVARLVKDKNIEMAIRAFSDSTARNSYVLEIYGDGPELQPLRKLVEDLAIQNRVLFMGDTFNVAEKIFKASIFINSSNSEGMPNSQMEAMGLGITCIATTCMAGNSNSLIRNRENGLLVPVGDQNALMEAINELVADPKKCETIGQEGSNIRYTYSSEIIRERWNRLLSCGL